MTGSVVGSGPTYISSRSADVILSDVRPIKLKHEALQSVNVLLDELLYTILSVARSIVTDQIKAALTKVVPTNLGKEALLEAEVELKAYWERTTPSTPADREAEGQFDLQWNFELLRLKCEAYSTMNDADEDAEAERRLNEKMKDISGSTQPKTSLLAPAALYLTAILESICEHILSNVSRVTARDSGRTVATVHDVFVALCEDDLVFGTFKSMKVYEQIEVLSKAQKPRRSKSFSRSVSSIERASTPSRTSSPHAELMSLRESSGTPARVRQSSESLKSSATATANGDAGGISRTSSERGKVMKRIMGHGHTRSSSDKDSANGITRGASEDGKSRGSTEFEQEDYDLLQEFDELMRSGATMKVSLTPDRLKSMEVYNRERGQRAGRRGVNDISPPIHYSLSDEQGILGPIVQSPDSMRPDPVRRTPSSSRVPALQLVDSIIEDDEELSHFPSPPPTPYHAVAAARARQTSLNSATHVAVSRSASQTSERYRAISISSTPHPRYDDAASRKSSASSKPISPMPPPKPSRSESMPKQFSGTPKRTRKVGRNRESVDLDDIMNGSDEDDVVETPGRSSLSPSTRTNGTSNTRKPHISSAARELIAFLEEGPPGEPPSFPHSPSANASVLSFESSKTAKSGRLQRMVSKLTMGGSSEKLGRGSTSADSLRGSVRRGSTRNGLSPPPAYMQQSLQGKRSFPSVIVATPPPRPPAISQSVVAPPTLSSVSSSTLSSADENSSQSTSTTPGTSLRRAATRKAVPAWEGDLSMSPRVPASAAVPVPSQTSDVEPTSPSSSGSVRRHPNGSARAEGAFERDNLALSSSGKPPSSRRPKSVGSSLRIPASPSLVVPPSPVGSRSPRSSSPRSEHSVNGLPSPRARHAHAPPERHAADLTIAAGEIDDFRRLMAAATSADECRLLMEMFLARNGFPCKTPTPPLARPAADASSASSASGAEGGAQDEEHERSFAEMYLGGCDVEYVAEEGSEESVQSSPGKEPMTPYEAPPMSLAVEKHEVEIPTLLMAH